MALREMTMGTARASVLDEQIGAIEVCLIMLSRDASAYSTELVPRRWYFLSHTYM